MPYISPGNRKMKIPTFSLPSEKTCPNATDLCKKYCYTKKAERAYPQVLPCREKNYMETYSMQFVVDVAKQILKKKYEYFRIHEGGDFYNQDYFDKWCWIAQLCQDTKFLAYTQNYKLDFRFKPNNLQIYWTVWPDSKDVPDTGLKAYVIDNGNNVIPNTLDQPETHQCPKEIVEGMTCDKCLWCYEGKGDVKFKLH